VKWLAAIFVTIGLPVLLADLNDVNVCRWLGERLVRRAVHRLPKEDRPRWEEEWVRHINDVPGRLPPLARAVQIFFGAGSWGRLLRGSPPVSEALRARMRAAWKRLRVRPKAPAEGPEARAFIAHGDAAQAISLSAVSATLSTSSAFMGNARVIQHPPDGMPRLSHEEFIGWLDRKSEETIDWLARQGEETIRRLAQQGNETMESLAQQGGETNRWFAQQRQEFDDHVNGDHAACSDSWCFAVGRKRTPRNEGPHA
jgi:hypothetical protein